MKHGHNNDLSNGFSRQFYVKEMRMCYGYSYSDLWLYPVTDRNIIYIYIYRNIYVFM